MAAIGGLWTLYTGLPEVCAAGAPDCVSQAWVVEQIRKIPIPAPLMTLAVTALGYYLRVKLQVSLQPPPAPPPTVDNQPVVAMKYPTVPAPLSPPEDPKV
jgi:hypothetical protein